MPFITLALISLGMLHARLHLRETGHVSVVGCAFRSTRHTNSYDDTSSTAALTARETAAAVSPFGAHKRI